MDSPCLAKGCDDPVFQKAMQAHTFTNKCRFQAQADMLTRQFDDLARHFGEMSARGETGASHFEVSKSAFAKGLETHSKELTELCQSVRLELDEQRLAHAQEMAALRQAHAEEMAALQQHAVRLVHQVKELRTSNDRLLREALNAMFRTGNLYAE